MNERGREIAANFRVASETRARYYSQATGWIDIGTFGGAYSRAHALNNRGEVVGEAQTVDGSYRAFAWSRTHGMRSLSGERSAAYGINDRGEIAGVRDGQAVVWRRGGQVEELGLLGEYGNGSVATDINELSQVVGYSVAGKHGRAGLLLDRRKGNDGIWAVLIPRTAHRLPRASTTRDRSSAGPELLPAPSRILSSRRCSGRSRSPRGNAPPASVQS